MNETFALVGLPELPAPPPPIREVNRLRDMKDDGVRDIIQIDPRRIVIEPGHNMRSFEFGDNLASIENLADDIAENGTLQPILVRFDAGTKQAILVDGERRLRANLLLIARTGEPRSIPCQGVDGRNEAERTIMALVANGSKPLLKWEDGIGYRKLVRCGWSVERIAKRVIRSEQFVREALELADAPDSVHRLLSERRVSDSLALSTLRKQGDRAAEVLQRAADEAAEKGKATARKKTAVSPRVRFARKVREVDVAAATAAAEVLGLGYADVVKVLETYAAMLEAKAESKGDSPAVATKAAKDAVAA
jgi:ParB/RepB/Spo0J family partition protein